jgi:hypothetical protein
MKVCSISRKKIQSDSFSGREVAIELDILSKKWKAGEMNISVPQNLYH